MTSKKDLLPRAKLTDVLTGNAPLVGSRFDPSRPRGFVSPVEARVLLGLAYADLAEEERKYLDAHGLGDDAAALIKAALAQAITFSGEPKEEERPFIVSARVDNITIQEALRRIFDLDFSNRGAIVYFVHPHALNLASFNEDFASRLAGADLVLPDGIGLRIAAGLLGVSLRHNVNGTDLFPLLCEEAARRKVPIALVGGAKGIAEEAARRMQVQVPGLTIGHVSHGYFDDLHTPEATVEAIRELGRCIVLVGMGSPIQEHWAWEHMRQLPHVTAVSVGGLFDFFSGRIPRAPMIYRELGLEWAYRLKQEPKRLAKRYLLGNPLFLALAMKQRLTKR